MLALVWSSISETRNGASRTSRTERATASAGARQSLLVSGCAVAWCEVAEQDQELVAAWRATMPPPRTAARSRVATLLSSSSPAA